MTITLRKSGQSGRSDIVYNGDVITHAQMDANFEHLVSVDDALTSRIVSLENTSLNLTAPSVQLTYDGSTGELTYTQGDTDTVAEGTTNLYYTDARFDTALASKTTDDLSEGTTNLYYTDARVQSLLDSESYATQTYVSGQVAAALSGQPQVALATVATSGDYNDLINKPDISGFSNDSGYITLADISAGGDLSYDNTTGVISYTQPTNISTFTNDSNYITLTSLTAGGDLSYDNTTGEVSFTQDKAYASLTGVPTDVSTFNNDSNYITLADLSATGDNISYDNTTGVINYTKPSTIFDVFRDQYPSTVSDGAIYFYIKALDNFRISWLATGQSDPTWDSIVGDIEGSDVSAIENAFANMPVLDQTPFLLPMVFIINAQVKIVNEALSKTYDTLTFDELMTHNMTNWNANNSGFETDRDTFENSLNATNTAFITGLLTNNSYEDFTADKVVTGWTPQNT